MNKQTLTKFGGYTLVAGLAFCFLCNFYNGIVLVTVGAAMLIVAQFQPEQPTST